MTHVVTSSLPSFFCTLTTKHTAPGKTGETFGRKGRTNEEPLVN